MLSHSSDSSEDETNNEEAADFSTRRHECLAIVLKNQTRVCGICLFRKDKTIEYFSSPIFHNASTSKGLSHSL